MSAIDKKGRVGLKKPTETDYKWEVDTKAENEVIGEEEARYSHLETLISELEPKENFSIVEVGVWNGSRAMRMSYAACKIFDSVSYTGYDLFEDITPDIINKELSNKPTVSMEHTTERLNWFIREIIIGPEFSYDLIKGDTNDTLKDKSIMADFVFIDGGHSVSTMENDYAAFKECPLVVLDDYYIGFDNAVTDRVGANKVVDLIREDPNYSVELIHGKHDVLTVNGVGGKIALAVVRKLNV